MTASASPQTPGIYFPAPLHLALWIGIGALLNQYLPARLEPPLALWFSGWAHVCAGIGLDLWCFWLFLSKKTPIMPHRGANTLVLRGPYRFTRNPMYLGLLLVHLGLIQNTGIAWYAATFLPALLSIRYLVIAREERHLREKFGEGYQAYCNQVPRWF